MRFIAFNVCAGALSASISLACLAEPASGPLTVHPTNPRYFADGSGKAIYLTGAHTWTNLQDTWSDSFNIVFDYNEYLDFLQQHHHNFMRMGREEMPKYKYSGEEYRYSAPHPWLVVEDSGGGGTVPPDGGPPGGPPVPGSAGQAGSGGGGLGAPPGSDNPTAKYDLEQFNQAYFDRLRQRVSGAGERGIYVSIMLFEGYGIQFTSEGWAWHPFNAGNNFNGIDGDPNGDGKGTETHTLQIPAVTTLQEAYVRKVIDTVNDLDNVLYEIANESIAGSIDWQNHFVNYIHEYEQTKPKQHPVLFTTPFPYSGDALWESSAEAVSPGAYSEQGSYAENPPASDGSKVVMLDSDHIFGCASNVPWIWKSFTRGMNVLYMDSYYDDTPFCSPPSEDMRLNLGYTNDYAQRMDLAHSLPSGSLSSTGYCRANPGVSYLVYAPGGGAISLNLSAAAGSLNVEWFNRITGTASASGTVLGGSVTSLNPPFSGDAVLFVFDPNSTPPPPPGGVIGDLNGDGLVNTSDVLVAISAWGPCPPPPAACVADINGNGVVGVDDLLIILNHWSAPGGTAMAGESAAVPGDQSVRAPASSAKKVAKKKKTGASKRLPATNTNSRHSNRRAS